MCSQKVILCMHHQKELQHKLPLKLDFWPKKLKTRNMKCTHLLFS